MPKRVLSTQTARALALIVALTAVGSVAHAQGETATERGPLAAAETAYLEVDFEGTRDHALAALRAGDNTPDQIVRVFLLLGIASSALGDEGAARDYFMRMLGIDPNATLDDSVPPRLRNPYLEARGAWAARPGRLSVTAGLDRSSSAVRVELRDPVEMARRVRVAARLEGEAEYTVNEYTSQSVILARVPGAAEADRVEYYVEVLDMHGNVILADGSAFDPAAVGRTAAAQNSSGGDGGGGILEDPVLWIIVGAVVLVAGGITLGVVLDQRSRIGIQTGITIGLD